MKYRSEYFEFFSETMQGIYVNTVSGENDYLAKCFNLNIFDRKYIHDLKYAPGN